MKKKLKNEMMKMNMDFVDAQFYPGYYVYFHFWASVPFVTSFEVGSRTLSVFNLLSLEPFSFFFFYFVISFRVVFVFVKYFVSYLIMSYLTCFSYLTLFALIRVRLNICVFKYHWLICLSRTCRIMPYFYFVLIFVYINVVKC